MDWLLYIHPFPGRKAVCLFSPQLKYLVFEDDLPALALSPY